MSHLSICHRQQVLLQQSFTVPVNKLTPIRLHSPKRENKQQFSKFSKSLLVGQSHDFKSTNSSNFPSSSRCHLHPSHCVAAFNIQGNSKVAFLSQKHQEKHTNPNFLSLKVGFVFDRKTGPPQKKNNTSNHPEFSEFTEFKNPQLLGSCF